MFGTKPCFGEGQVGDAQSTPLTSSVAADARTYYSRLQVNHGMEFEEAQQYRDDYIQGKRDAGLQVSDRNGFYISSTIKDQGKTGSLYVLGHLSSRPLHIY